MAKLIQSLVRLLATASVAAAADYSSVIERDVVIIGGGASGAHAAFRLREDVGKSIVLIEKEARLGGHVNSYVDPESGKAYDYGVQPFNDVHGASEFVTERLGVEVKAPGRVSRTTRYVDFDTGEQVNYTGPAPADQSAALAKYAELCAQYEDMILPSFWDFPAPHDIPEDLLIPFGDFVKKYDIEAVVPLLFQVTGLGVGDVRSTWWTGGAWVAQFQTHLWWYNDVLLPKLVEGL
ncbi:amine oxidase [Fusarium albosuccineum]|uniref:Amine oxidase n=1 Tax=Fusarium albosuccineum TaxID=1237068 RepID=A0A8H4L041_9HYPO|nr:amine oxidase [Fusarium albosuccineum]